MSAVAKLAINMSLAGASTVLGSFQSVLATAGKFGSAFSGANQNLFYFINNMKSISEFGRDATNFLIKPSVDQEGFLEQIAFIKRDAQAARAQLDSLFRIANQESAPTSDVVKLYLALERVTQGTQTSEKDLSLWVRSGKAVGMMAESMGQSIANLYSFAERGDDLTRPLREFHKLGLISQETYKNLIGMSGSPPSAFMDEFKKGLAQQVSGTEISLPLISDAKVRMSNMFTEIRRQVGSGLYSGLRDDIDALSVHLEKAFDEKIVEQWAANLSTKIRGMYDTARTASLAGITGEDLINSMKIGTTGDLIKEMLGTAADNFWIAMAHGAKKHGPDIQMALIPEILHNKLGLKDAAERAKNLGPAEFNRVDANVVRALTNPELARALASVVPSNMEFNGMRIGGLQYTDKQGNTMLYDRSQLEDILKAMNLSAQNMEKAAITLEASSRKLDQAAARGARF